ncbi:hypothetical protein ACFX2I_022667 [Malus domestica]
MLVRKAIQIVSETMAAVEKVIRTISEAEAVVGKGSGDVEDMFVNDVGGCNSSSVNVLLPALSSDKSLVMPEGFKFAMTIRLGYLAPKCMFPGEASNTAFSWVKLHAQLNEVFVAWGSYLHYRTKI